MIRFSAILAVVVVAVGLLVAGAVSAACRWSTWPSAWRAGPAHADRGVVIWRDEIFGDQPVATARTQQRPGRGRPASGARQDIRSCPRTPSPRCTPAAAGVPKVTEHAAGSRSTDRGRRPGRPSARPSDRPARTGRPGWRAQAAPVWPRRTAALGQQASRPRQGRRRQLAEARRRTAGSGEGQPAAPSPEPPGRRATSRSKARPARGRASAIGRASEPPTRQAQPLSPGPRAPAGSGPPGIEPAQGGASPYKAPARPMPIAAGKVRAGRRPRPSLAGPAKPGHPARHPRSLASREAVRPTPGQTISHRPGKAVTGYRLARHRKAGRHRIRLRSAPRLGQRRPASGPPSMIAPAPPHAGPRLRQRFRAGLAPRHRTRPTGRASGARGRPHLRPSSASPASARGHPASASGRPPPPRSRPLPGEPTHRPRPRGERRTALAEGRRRRHRRRARSPLERRTATPRRGPVPAARRDRGRAPAAGRVPAGASGSRPARRGRGRPRPAPGLRRPGPPGHRGSRHRPVSPG